jgi:hypothetical protein
MTITLNGTTGVTTPTGVFSDASGNVGIGTTSPATKLNLSANAPVIRLTDTDTSLSDGELSSGIAFYQSDTSGPGAGAQIGVYADGTAGLLQMRFYTGANTEAMRIDADGVVTGTAGNLMLVRGTADPSTSGTAIGFTGIPSWAKRVTLVLQNVQTSSTAQWIVQIGSGSYTSSGYDSVSQTTYSASGAVIAQTTGMAIYHNAAATYVSGTMTFTNISGNIWVQNHTFTYSNDGSTQGGGFVTLGGALDRIQITTIGGANTFTDGLINVLYE